MHILSVLFVCVLINNSIASNNGNSGEVTVSTIKATRHTKTSFPIGSQNDSKNSERFNSDTGTTTYQDTLLGFPDSAADSKFTGRTTDETTKSSQIETTPANAYTWSGQDFASKPPETLANTLDNWLQIAEVTQKSDETLISTTTKSNEDSQFTEIFKSNDEMTTYQDTPFVYSDLITYSNLLGKNTHDATGSSQIETTTANSYTSSGQDFVSISPKTLANILAENWSQTAEVAQKRSDETLISTTAKPNEDFQYTEILKNNDETTTYQDTLLIYSDSTTYSNLSRRNTVEATESIKVENTIAKTYSSSRQQDFEERTQQDSSHDGPKTSSVAYKVSDETTPIPLVKIRTLNTYPSSGEETQSSFNDHRGSSTIQATQSENEVESDFLISNRFKEYSRYPKEKTIIIKNTKDITTTSSDVSTSLVKATIPNCEVGFSIEGTAAHKTRIEVNFIIKKLHSIENCYHMLSLNCEASNEQNLEWVIPYGNVSRRINDNDDPKITLILDNLSEHTTYNCTANLRTAKKIFETSTTFQETTLEEVPQNINFTISQVKADSFIVEWEKPRKIPGSLKKYHIIIKDLGPKHYIMNKCKSDITPSPISFESLEEYQTFEIKDNIQPFHEYEIQILAEDNAGNSTGIPQTITTKSSKPEMPQNATHEIIKYSNGCENDEYNISLLIKWVLPCNTHGELKEFLLETSSQKFRKNSVSQTDITYTARIPVTNDTHKIYYEYILHNLNASTSYYTKIIPISKEGLRGAQAEVRSGRIEDGCPPPPRNVYVMNITPTEFSIHWDEPEQYNGDITEYTVRVLYSFPSDHFISRDTQCPKQSLSESYEINCYDTSWDFHNGHPDFEYSVAVRAKTSAGFGEYTDPYNFTTPPKEPEPVRDLRLSGDPINISPETYKYRIRIEFKEPCNTNGRFKKYRIIEKTIGEIVPKLYPVSSSTNVLAHDFISTVPEQEYSFTIQVVAEGGESEIVESNIVRTSAGIPPTNIKGFEYSINEDNPTQIDIILHKNVSSDANGKIKYYVVIIARSLSESIVYQTTSYGFWNKTSTSMIIPYTADLIQLNVSNPFEDGSSDIRLSIGKTEDCGKNDYCNPLLKDTTYVMVLRSCTANTYSDIYAIFRTGSSSGPGIGIFIIIFLLIILGALTLLLMRERKMCIFSRKEESSKVVPRYIIPTKHFISYHNKLLNEPSLLKRQYDDIDDETKLYKQNCVNTNYAMKPENKRKNRYTNILPYDEYRVQLKIEEDDEIGSDYINASYIKGYSRKVEYIATQGPLEHTCKDFWKMIIQENVTVIVMVSQFIENDKEKCFKYFPNNHGNMLISEDFEVKCITELQFDNHYIRTLLVRKDLLQKYIVHIQYLEWPDFGCPKETSHILNFCKEIRDRIELEKGLMLVHCSAGVGRTGTLISLDILLQTLKRKKEISIFETVLELRRQRTHMVQTQKQYVFIHTCIRDALENTKLYLTDDLKSMDEHTYVNTFFLNQGTKSKPKQHESFF